MAARDGRDLVDNFDLCMLLRFSRGLPRARFLTDTIMLRVISDNRLGQPQGGRR